MTRAWSNPGGASVRGCFVVTLALLAGCTETIGRSTARDVVYDDGADDDLASDASADADEVEDTSDGDLFDAVLRFDGDLGDRFDGDLGDHFDGDLGDHFDGDLGDHFDGDLGDHDATRDAASADGPDPRVCARAPMIGVGVIEGVFSGATERVTDCQSPSGVPRPALFGRVAVPPRHLLRATASPFYSVSLFEGCDTSRCLPARYGGSSASLIHPGDQARSVTLALTGSFETSPIPANLRIELTAARPEDLCAIAREVGADTSVRLEPALAIDLRRHCDSSEELASSFVRVRVRAGERVVASAADTILRFFADCEAATCLPGPRTPSAMWTNDGTADRTVVLAVSARSPGPRTVTLSLGLPPPTSRCTTAPPLPTGLQTLDHSSAGPDLACGNNATAIWYRASVPPGYRLAVVAEGSPSTPVLHLQEGCEGARCFLDADVWRGGRSSTILWDNATATARELRVAAVAALTLHAEITAIPDTARCDTAPLLTPATPLRDVRLPDRAEVAARCNAMPLRGRIYRVRVPALSRIDVALQPANSDAYVALMSSCGEGACLASGAGTFPGRFSFRWINAESVERERFLVVGLQESVAPVAVNAALDLAYEPPLDLARCSGARQVRAGEVITDAREADARELASLCDTTGGAASALFYAIDVPAGRRLRVTGQLGPVVQGRLSVLEACGGMCLAGNAATDGGVSWRNDGATRRVIVAFFGLPFVLRSLPYSLSFAVE